MESPLGNMEITPFESVGQKSVRERLELVVKEGSHARVLLMMRELKRTLETKDVFFNIKKGIINYIYAVGALAFACKEISVDNVSRLLLSIRIEPERQMLETIRAMHYKDFNIYLNILYFMMAIGIEPTIDGVIDMLRAMEFSPDATIAGYTIEYFKEFNSGKISYNIPEPEGDLSVIFNKMADMSFSLSGIISNFVIKEIEGLMHDERIARYPERDILPYIGAIGLLTFSGKDTDRGNIISVLDAMATTSDQDILDTLGKIHVRNHIIYIVALYFIHATGQEPTFDKLIDVIKAMDVIPDALVAGNVISFYKIAGMDPKAMQK